MKHSFVIAAVSVCLIAPLVVAQEAPKKPGPEHKKLEAFAGKWKFAETNLASPFGPAGTMKINSQMRMVLGGFFLEERADGVGSEGPESWQVVTAYDSEAGHYVNLSFNSSGVFTKPGKQDYQALKNQGNTWTGTWTREKNGKNYQCRFVWTFGPDNKSASYEWAYSEDGVRWMNLGGGVGKKVGRAR